MISVIGCHRHRLVFLGVINKMNGCLLLLVRVRKSKLNGAELVILLSSFVAHTILLSLFDATEEVSILHSHYVCNLLVLSIMSLVVLFLQ